jgi:D-alanyl-D-alanine carboxypeptidase
MIIPLKTPKALIDELEYSASAQDLVRIVEKLLKLNPRLVSYDTSTEEFKVNEDSNS